LQLLAYPYDFSTIIGRNRISFGGALFALPAHRSISFMAHANAANVGMRSICFSGSVFLSLFSDVRATRPKIKVEQRARFPRLLLFRL